jgi:hypothetical protein
MRRARTSRDDERILRDRHLFYKMETLPPLARPSDRGCPMPRRRSAALRATARLALACTIAAATLDAQPRPTVRAPGTPVGAVLRAWLDAFDSADSARMDAYYRRHDPERDVASELAFRRMVGGFDLVGIERSEPRRVQFLVRERNRPMTAFGLMQLADGGDARLKTFSLMALGDTVSTAALRIDAAERARVVAGAAAALDSFYVFPDVARRMGDTLRARLARGAYDDEISGPVFALTLERELRSVYDDKHMRFDYSFRPLPPMPPPDSEPPRSPQDAARDRERMERGNCSFRTVERLDGNVGYLRFDGFADPEFCERTVAAAMTFLAGTRALVIDLRQNGGGSPEMVTLIASYLFDARTHVNDLWTRSTGATKEFWTRDTLAGPRYGGTKPVYVLTSARTISAAEELTYDLQSLKRATIVGETTAGGAHPVSAHRIDGHFFIGVPFARAVNPITHTNWEGSGVVPDVKVPATDALAKAQALLREPPRQ